MKSKQGKPPGTRKVATTGPNGVVKENQWQSSQRQQDALKYYMDPAEKETWGNAFKSLTKAGYSDNWASKLSSKGTLTEWFLQAVDIQRINPMHLQQKLQKIINDPMEETKDQLTAMKMLGGEMGMFQSTIRVKEVSAVEQALNEVLDM